MKRLVITKILACSCLVCIIAMVLSGCSLKKPISSKSMNTNQWGVGWNLGNTLDSVDFKQKGSVEYYETLWGNPVTTKQMIDTVKSAGFGTIRVPVTWYDHVDENGIIDADWMDRVGEVVQYVLDNGLNCIINLHHDTGKVAWIKADVSKKEEMKQIVQSLWKQIADYFQSYDENLIFEGMNEILNIQNQWDGASDEELNMVNEMNQVFVNTIRESGKKNAERLLIVNTYAASTDKKVLDAFSMPKDIIADHLIAEVHFYGHDEDSIDAMLERLDKKFVQNEIPVIIGECGMENKPEEGKTREKRLEYAQYLITKAKEKGIACFWWDNGGKFKNSEEVNNFALLNRQQCEWYDKELVDTIIKSSKT
ncbi:MAG: glycoside hydrolase family 5 protein [Clostridiales bacterium]|nr:glycoside hydrolase family 5 protein [Clostridiales bacterium]